MTLRLGVIGISDGNGHPYSWSAIFNGYEVESIESCGFPAIPRYLEQQSWPNARIGGAEVVAVWTQSEELSQRVACATRIPKVCETVGELIQSVDAVLLARDDAENHWQFAQPVLESGKPIYIDKPAALSIQDLQRLYEAEQYPGQIFTCSALRYAKELKLNANDRAALGGVKEVIATTPKSWSKYAIHIIEPVLNLLSIADEQVSVSGHRTRSRQDGSGSLLVEWGSGVRTAFHALGSVSSPVTIRVYGEDDWKELTFNDSFSAFRGALQDFVEGVETGTARSSQQFNQKAIALVEAGLR